MDSERYSHLTGCPPIDALVDYLASSLERQDRHPADADVGRHVARCRVCGTVAGEITMALTRGVDPAPLDPRLRASLR